MGRPGMIAGIVLLGCGSAPDDYELYNSQPTTINAEELHNNEMGTIARPNQPGQPSPDASPPTSELASLPASHNATVPQGDLTPPTVLWTSPTNGELGVSSDAPIVIQFSEPMTTPSVEEALTSNLPHGFRTHWEKDNSQLRIVPLEPLPYAEGDVDLTPLTFNFQLSNQALDRAGNALQTPEVSFSTLRRFEQTLLPLEDRALSGVFPSEERPPLAPSTEVNAVDSPRARDSDSFLEEECLRGNALCVGDSLLFEDQWVQRKVFLSYSLESLPDGVRVNFAQLRVQAEHVLGDPFGSEGLGELHVERTHFDAVGPEPFFSDPDATLAVLSEKNTDVESDDISWVINEARTRGVTQYRLTFPQQTNRDDVSDLVVFALRKQVLVVSYLTP